MLHSAIKKSGWLETWRRKAISSSVKDGERTGPSPVFDLVICTHPSKKIQSCTILILICSFIFYTRPSCCFLISTFAPLLSLRLSLSVLRCQYFERSHIISKELGGPIMGCRLCVYVCTCSMGPNMAELVFLWFAALLFWNPRLFFFSMICNIYVASWLLHHPSMSKVFG